MTLREAFKKYLQKNMEFSIYWLTPSPPLHMENIQMTPPDPPIYGKFQMFFADTF